MILTAAALIMVFVFGSFLLEEDRVVKLIGVGLATAVLLDATIVRMLLVPATMELLGDRNWWLPRWLDRLLPRIDVEGGHEPIAPGPRHPSPTTTPSASSSRSSSTARRPGQLRDERSCPGHIRRVVPSHESCCSEPRRRVPSS